MARRKNLKLDAPSLPVPQDKTQAAEAVARLAVIRAELETIRANAETAIANTNAAVARAAEPLVAEQKELMKSLATFANANRDELTSGGKTKTVKLSTGVMQWRMTPLKVRLANVELVTNRLKALNMPQFLRTKTEVDKDAILKSTASREQAEAVEGITISQKEEFVVKPAETNIEEVV